MSKKTKTNVMRILDKENIEYNSIEYDVSEGFVSGVDAAKKTGRDEKTVFKTLIAIGNSREYYTFVIPVAEELDLKKAAKAVGEKKIEMLPSKNITAVTGYIKGGCSPIGMKKQFDTYIHVSAEKLPCIYVSGGKPGVSISINPLNLIEIVRGKFENIIVD